MHDVPYVHSRDVGPEITASMAVICKEVKRTFGSKPVGVQILAGANLQALAVAKAAGLQFVRMEGFVFSHVADEGWMDACAGEVLRYRKSLDADDIMIFTDIKKKHSAHTVTSDVSISETASAAEFFLSDGVIVTGSSTGKAADIQDLKDVQNSVSIPVLIGSGVTSMNFDLYKSANGVIVGSHFKENGKWTNKIDRGRIEEFITTATK
ncbi:hypothetical protein FSP39_011147 [Pinctada imbricata]|uniref:BtpA family membrane complex biogenesis protein n=1 Tax=Pinctada imbricata TaxID=66713 RepID=A0AA88XKE5_PINIB|nr:hypothetical protein FSP39_011147 [Pinctada imbricata]